MKNFKVFNINYNFDETIPDLETTFRIQLEEDVEDHNLQEELANAISDLTGFFVESFDYHRLNVCSKCNSANNIIQCGSYTMDMDENGEPDYDSIELDFEYYRCLNCENEFKEY